MAENKDEINEYKLEADSELRFEIETKGKTAIVELRSGMAELFGTELVRTKPYEFTTGAKVAIFTYHGCVIVIKGYTDVCYQAKETPMIQYLNCHTALEQMRRKAEEENGTGPKVMVCGPTDVGKTTMCRIFLNYAVRMGRRPVYVDVDVGQGSIGVPGTIGALLIGRPAAVEENFSQLAPLVYHFGDKSPDRNHTLYDMLITKLAEVTQLRLESNKKAKYSGMIINTCGWVRGGGYRSLVHIAKAFEVDVIFALDQERLYNGLLNDQDLKGRTKVIYLPKSGGVVERSREIRAESRDLRMREYFYGSKLPLYPHSFDVKWSEMKVYKIGAPSLPDSCMPLGMKAEDNKTKLVQVQPGMDLLHHILAVSFAASVEEEVITTNVAGFICVANVDAAREVCTVLSPEQRPLPNTLLLMSELMFVDTH